MTLRGITGIINTKNEASNIANAIRSLKTLVDEVLVADMGSTDDTRAIATSMGARVLNVEDFSYVEPARKFAAESAQYEWLMFLDADEVLPRSLCAALRRLAESDEVDVVVISRMNFMFGHRITGGGWGTSNDRVVRFFRAGCVVLPDVIHQTPVAVESARVHQLASTDDLSIVHFNYLDWGHFVGKMNRYTEVEATTRVSRSESTMSGWRLAWFLFRRVFWRRFVRQRGYRDGVRGLGLVWMMMTYHVLIQLKQRHLLEYPLDGDVQAVYARISDEVFFGASSSSGTGS